MDTDPRFNDGHSLLWGASSCGDDAIAAFCYICAMPEHVQKFGGPWSLLKVDLVGKYFNAFNIALRLKPSPQRPFKRVCIDTFAGSGSFKFVDDLPLVKEDEAQHIHEGSVKKALAAQPPFDELYFIENNPKNAASLRAVVNGDPRVTIIEGDANTETIALLARLDWRSRRGVIFVDPYGPECGWDMVRAIAKTQALDMWWLFPISAVYRNAPHDQADITPDKRAVVAKCMDDANWEASFYRKETAPAPSQDSLFPEENQKPPKETIYRLSVGEIESIVTAKLKTLFPHVEKPAALLGPSNAQLFSLYFAVSNPSGPAIAAASSIARDLLSRL